MKTTIAITKGKRVIVEPNGAGGVTLYTGPHNEPIEMSEAQAGALIFGLEQAAEAARIAQERATLTA